MAPIDISCFSPMSRLYPIMSLPLQLGSFQVRLMVVAVALERMCITGEGLEGGVTVVATGLKGPAPALLIACIMNKTHL